MACTGTVSIAHSTDDRLSNDPRNLLPAVEPVTKHRNPLATITTSSNKKLKVISGQAHGKASTASPAAQQRVKTHNTQSVLGRDEACDDKPAPAAVKAKKSPSEKQSDVSSTGQKRGRLLESDNARCSALRKPTGDRATDLNLVRDIHNALEDCLRVGDSKRTALRKLAWMDFDIKFAGFLWDRLEQSNPDYFILYDL
eukprot:scaffold32140_cov44-Prasinocladus_malaysianus.AAC.1